MKKTKEKFPYYIRKELCFKTGIRTEKGRKKKIFYILCDFVQKLISLNFFLSIIIPRKIGDFLKFEKPVLRHCFFDKI